MKLPNEVGLLIESDSVAGIVLLMVFGVDEVILVMFLLLNFVKFSRNMFGLLLFGVLLGIEWNIRKTWWVLDMVIGIVWLV